jgi:HEAT repeat protein
VLLDILGHPGHPDFAGLSDDPRNIVSALEEEQGAAREEHLVLVRQLAAHGSTASRLAAARVLAKLRDMNNAPALIAALSDREWPIVYTADQGLRFLSRRVGLKTVTELPDETAREATIAEWKRWYAGVSPGTAETP